MMKSIAIIGYGRFGQLLASLAKTHFEIHILESDVEKTQQATQEGYEVITIDQLNRVDYIFVAVPISLFEATIKAIEPHLRSSQVVIDLCSVKVYPVAIMKKYLKNVQILGSHPMFGPDSASKGLEGLQVALCPINITEDNLETVRSFWESMGVKSLETTPEEHDMDTAYSQAFTYSIADIINNTNVPDIRFRTRSFNSIYEVATLSAKDSKQLFHDMLFYNPYFADMKVKLENSFGRTLTTLDAIQAEQDESELFHQT